MWLFSRGICFKISHRPRANPSSSKARTWASSCTAPGCLPGCFRPANVSDPTYNHPVLIDFCTGHLQVFFNFHASFFFHDIFIDPWRMWAKSWTSFYCWSYLVNSFRSLSCEPHEPHRTESNPSSISTYILFLKHTVHFSLAPSLLGKPSSSTQLLKTQTVECSGKTTVHALSLIVPVIRSDLELVNALFLGFSHCYFCVRLMRPNDPDGPKARNHHFVSQYSPIHHQVSFLTPKKPPHLCSYCS